MGAVSWLERARVGAAVLSVACAGGLFAYGLAPRAPAHAAVPAVEVRVGGEADLDVRALAERWASERVTLAIEGEPDCTRTRAEWGASLDVAALEAMIAQARDPSSAMRRLHAQLEGARREGARLEGRPLELPLVVRFDPRASFELLADRKDGYDRGPVDARLDVRTSAISPHRDGRRLDVHGTMDALERAMRRGETRVSAVVRVERAGRRGEELASVDASGVIGFFETRYNNTADARDRTFNLEVAASKIDGLVVMPGEELDFNEVVGPRSEANGFRPAPVIAQGELVDGVGGGTCQIAGTLHGAVFFAGLPIVERGPHSRPSSYIFMGLDAVVAYPQLNFRFRNDRETPIAIGATVEGGIVRVELRGAPADRMVTFVRRVDEIVPFEEREVPDPSLPRGERVLRQRGTPGFHIRTWRIVREQARNQAVRTHAEDRYPPTTQIWRVGSGGPAPEGFVPPPGDDHLEYTCDEYLSVSEGAGIEGMQIVRRAGRTGVAGWTDSLSRRAQP